MNKVGILYDNISGNTGDVAIGLSIKKILQDSGVKFDELIPGNFTPNDYDTIIIGGGHLIRPSPDFFYDKFKVPGNHILNAVGTLGTPDDLNYLNDYKYVSVRTSWDKERLSYLKKEVHIVPCTTMLLEDLDDAPINPKHPSLGIHLMPHIFNEEEEMQFIDWISSLPFTVYFLPITYYNQDYIYLSYLNAKIGNSVLLPLMNPLEIFTFVGKLDYFISCSLHGGIFAYKHNVPFILFNYDEKMLYFMKDRGLTRYTFSNLNEMKISFEDLLMDTPDYSEIISKDLLSLQDHINILKEFLSVEFREQKPKTYGPSPNYQIHSLQSQIRAYEKQLRIATQKIEDMRQNLVDRDGQISALSQEIANMRRSVAWKLHIKYHSGFVERFMPPDTGRRSFYNLALEGGRILVNEGLRSLSFRASKKLSVRVPFLKEDLSVPLFETKPLRCHSPTPLSLDESLSGEFFFPAAGINEIRIITATYMRKNGDLALYLRKSADGPIIRAAKVKGHAIQDNDYTSFRFKPVKEGPGEKVFFELKSVGEPSAAVLYDPSNSSGELKLYRSGEEIEGYIALQAFSNLELRDRYHIWRLKNEPSQKELDELKKKAMAFEYRPKISIITPVWNTDEEWLRLAIDSVLDQIYDNWEFCIADGGSEKPHVKKVLEEYAKKDSRIKVMFLSENKGIAGNSNEALSMATGDFMALLDHDDELVPFSLYEVVKLLNENPFLDYVYSDEDKIDRNGARRDPFFKPDWSPDMFLSCNYLCHLSVIRNSVVDDVGGFKSGYDGSQDYDLFLRVTERIGEDRIGHIPKILYHWRIIPESAASSYQAKPYAYVAAKKALKEAMGRRKIEIDDIYNGLWDGVYRVKYKIGDRNPKVTIIIPTKDNVEILKICINSIINITEYDNYEILIVDNESEEKSTYLYYEDIKNNPKINILNYNHSFNFSSINNYAVSKAGSEYLLFLNNDVEVLNSEWLSSLIEHIQRDEVGAVGAKLLYPNDTIQHAGVVTGIVGNPPIGGHVHRHFPRSHPGYFVRLQMIQNFSAVTAACMMTKKSVFEEVGGFDEANLAVAFNDVDYCLKLRRNGYLIVFTPYAELYHHESLSRGSEDTPEKQERFMREVAYMREKWGELLDNDPYYNPNLTRDREDFSLR